jgi:tetratricopeptide (TPR) repeat protein
LAASRDADEAFRTGDYDKAISLYFDFLGQFPDDFRAWLNLGIALGRIGKPQDSVKCFDRAIELDSRSVEAWYNLGLALHAMGRNVDEIRCYDRALQLKPWYQLAILRKVEALRLLGREDEASALFREFMARRKNGLAEAAR